MFLLDSMFRCCLYDLASAIVLKQSGSTGECFDLLRFVSISNSINDFPFLVQGFFAFSEFPFLVWVPCFPFGFLITFVLCLFDYICTIAESPLISVFLFCLGSRISSTISWGRINVHHVSCIWRCWTYKFFYCNILEKFIVIMI